MSASYSRFSTVVLLGLATAAAASPLHAATRTVTFCNKNALNVEVAWGFDQAQKGLTSAGWRTIAACACRELFTEDLRSTEIWLLVIKEGSLQRNLPRTALSIREMMAGERHWRG